MEAILYVSHELSDREHCVALTRHLASVVARSGHPVWHRGLTKPGEDEESLARSKLTSAALVLLLVSADYLSSSSCLKEMQSALVRSQRGEIRVIPILLRPCVVADERIGGLQSLPSNKTPVTSWGNQDEAWTDVVRGVAGALASLPRPSNPDLPATPPDRRLALQEVAVEPTTKPDHKKLVRVAVAQLDYHPALYADHRCPLEDPGGTRPLLPASSELPPEQRPRFEKLRARVRGAYGNQMLARLTRIVETCRHWEVKILVLPEYSVPWELLLPLAHECGPMVVVAGTHLVERAALAHNIYAELGCPESDLPEVGQAVAPVLHNGRILALVPKLSAPSSAAESYEPGARFRPVPMPEGIPGPMGVLTCLDLSHPESPAYRAHVAGRLAECQFLAVPGRTPAPSAPQLQARAWEEARRYGRPVLFADHARAGGTALFVDEEGLSDLLPYPERSGRLRPDEEGVIVADVDLGFHRSAGSRRDGSTPPVVPQAVASLAYTAMPAEMDYGTWFSGLIDVLETHVPSRLDAALRHARSHAQILERVRDSGGPSRRERLERLLQERGRFITNMAQFEQLTTEVLFHPGVLPPAVLRAAHLEACEEAILRWLTKSPAMSRAVTPLLEAASGIHSPLIVDKVRKVVEREKDLVRGTKKERVQPDAYFGGSFAAQNGVLLTLRRHAREFEPSLSHAAAARMLGMKVEDEPLPRSRHSRDDRNTDFWSMQIPQIYAHLMVLFWDLLCAEGQEPVAAVVVKTVFQLDPWGRVVTQGRGLARQGAKLFLLCRRGEGLLLTTYEPQIRTSKSPEGEDAEEEEDRLFWRFQERDREPLLDAFEEWGMELSDIEVVGEESFSPRFDAVLRRFDGARATVERIRRDRLASVEGCFVEPSLATTLQSLVGAEYQTERITRPALEALSGWLEGRRASAYSPQAALLLGEYGSGKSTLLAEWACHLWNAEKGPRPILVDLARSSAPSPEVLLLGAAGLTDTPANRAALQMGIRSGWLLPIFDGFDEMATRVTVGELPQRLADLLDTAQLEGRIVLSSRDHYFPTEGELKSAFDRALKASLKGPSSAERLTLCLFSHEQIQALVRRVTNDDEEAAILWRRIRETYDLEELCGRPLLLSMVIASRHELLRTSDFRRTDLYDACLNRWLAQAGGVEREIFSNAQKRSLAETIACETWRSGEEGTSLETLRGLLHKSFPPSFFDDLPRTAEVLETTGGMFLVREPTVSGDRFRFAHKSFLEYFLASALLRASEAGSAALVEALSTRPLTNEVMDFLEEILARRGSVREAPFVTSLQSWLSARCADPKRPPALTADAASNAALVLIRLARRSGESTGWLPRGADLRETALAGVDLFGVDLRECNLAGADLSMANLRDANLAGACLRGAILTGARLDRAVLVGVRASEADFAMAQAEGANLTAADLRAAILRQSSWTSCTWDRVEREGADGFAWLVRDSEGLDGSKSPVPWRPDDARLEPVIDPDANPFQSEIIAGAWLSGGRTVGALSMDGCWRVWDVASGKRLFDTVGTGFRRAAACGAGTTVAFVDDRNDIQLWTVHRPWDLRRIPGPARNVCLSHDGGLIAVEDPEGNIQIADVRTGETVPGQRRWGDEVAWMSFSPDAAWLAVVYRGGPGVILSLRDERVSVFPVEADEDLRICWRPGYDGMLAVSAGDFLLGLVDLRSDGEPSHILLNQKGFFQLAFSPSGRYLAAVDEAGRVHVWDMSQRVEIAMFEQHPPSMLNPPPPALCAWSPDETRIATFGPDVRIWEWRRPRLLARLPGSSKVAGHRGSWGLGLLRWSTDSRSLVWRGPRFEGAVVVDVVAGRLSLVPISEAPEGESGMNADVKGPGAEETWLEPLLVAASRVHRSSVVSVTPSPDRSRVATLDADGTLALWSAALQTLVCTVSATGHSVLVRDPEGRCVYLAGSEEEHRLAAVAEPGCLVRVYAPAGGLLRTLSDGDGGILPC